MNSSTYSLDFHIVLIDIQLAKKLFEDKGVKYNGKEILWLLSYSFCKANRYLTLCLFLLTNKLTPLIYTAIELDKESDGQQLRTAISESIGNGKIPTPAIWIRGQFIGDFNALNKLNTNGELDSLLTFIPKTTHTSPR